MNDYFDQFEFAVATALEDRSHVPWYLRLSRPRPARGLVVVLAALVIATPAVGAVSNWFGLGAPDQIRNPSSSIGQGGMVTDTSRLLAVRVADPQGGPAWGLRQVRTTRGDVCLQAGRVEDGKLGSLGIDDASGNDRLFHAFPSAYVGDVCGSADALGDGFVNVINYGAVANAVPQASPSLASCHPRLMWPQVKGVHFPSLASVPRPSGPTCLAGSARIVASGLLGPEAKAITYRAPNGKLHTESTTGRDGAYLLVFTLDQHTCTLYARGGPCGESYSESAASLAAPGPVKSILYRDGHSCTVTATKPCPAVGFVATDTKPITAAQAAAPITVRSYHADRWCTPTRSTTHALVWIPCENTVPAGYRRLDLGGVGRSYAPGVLADISFKAPVAITTSSSWYSITIGKTGSTDGGDVRRGQTVQDQELELNNTHRVYHGEIHYVYYKGPINTVAPDGSGTSVLVGRFSFQAP